MTCDPTTRALELAAAFAEQRHSVLADNIANIDTPDYASKRLDPVAFQASLREAIARAEQPANSAAMLREQIETVPAQGAMEPTSGGIPTRSGSTDSFRRTARDADDALILRNNAQFQHDAAGEITVNPAIDPGENVLFHDGTNASIEKLMSDASENNLYYQMATNLLHNRYELLLTAIRGRV